ncbi:MAG TPA: hypothetical protein VJ951_15370 [Bacteroidales bacterium]|nr:hypothetical protein [Bacteroidales bacterium]
MGFFLHFIFITAFLLLYVISIIVLQPFRIHRKRPVSTISLKVSYLIYMASFMLLAYFVLFYSVNQEPAEDLSEESIITWFSIFSILAFFIPNIGIMIRRRIKSWRVAYNYLFTFLNLAFAGGLIYYITDIAWEFS